MHGCSCLLLWLNLQWLAFINRHTIIFSFCEVLHSYIVITIDTIYSNIIVQVLYGWFQGLYSSSTRVWRMKTCLIKANAYWFNELKNSMERFYGNYFEIEIYSPRDCSWNYSLLSPPSCSTDTILPYAFFYRLSQLVTGPFSCGLLQCLTGYLAPAPAN